MPNHNQLNKQQPIWESSEFQSLEKDVVEIYHQGIELIRHITDSYPLPPGYVWMLNAANKIRPYYNGPTGDD